MTDSLPPETPRPSRRSWTSCLLTGLFDCVGIKPNTTKTEVMTFVPGKVQTSLLNTAYRARMDEDFRGKDKGRKVECGKCSKMLEVGLLAGHLAKQHDIYQSFKLKEDQDGSPSPSPRQWEASVLSAEGCYRCPGPGCPQGCQGRDEA